LLHYIIYDFYETYNLYSGLTDNIVLYDLASCIKIEFMAQCHWA